MTRVPLSKLAAAAYADVTSVCAEPPKLVDVLARLDGAFPTEVAHALDDLALKYSVESSRQTHTRYTVELHPLYYEWYFTPATAEGLASEVPVGAEVLCLGTPTVAAALTKRSQYM